MTIDYILLTGKSGFLGRYIYNFLEESQHFKRVDTLGRSKNCTWHFDLEKDLSPVSQSYDLVIHSAGKAHFVPRTAAEKQAFFDVNLEGTKKLLKALEQNPPKAFVLISTIAVYGLDKGTGIQEHAPLAASEPYGLSKKLAEDIVIDWCNKYNCICTIFRLPLIVGENPPGNLGAMMKGIKSGRYFRIGKGAGKKSMVLAEDVAKIIPQAAPIGGIFNLTDGEHPSFMQIEEVMAKSFHKKVKILPAAFARLIGYGGDLINFMLRKRVFPLDSRAYRKITSTLTLDDRLARKKIGWMPKSVLKYIENNIS